MRVSPPGASRSGSTWKTALEGAERILSADSPLGALHAIAAFTCNLQKCKRGRKHFARGLAQLFGDGPVAERDAVRDLVLHADALFVLHDFDEARDDRGVVLREHRRDGVEARGLVHVLEEGLDCGVDLRCL